MSECVIPVSSDINSYSEIYALGNKAIDGLLDLPVLVEEKVDGSQFSVRKVDGVVNFRSHGKQLYVNENGQASEKMFQLAVDNLKDIDFHEGWTYRGEFLKTPHHNTLAYDRVPKNNWVVFDIDMGNQYYLDYASKLQEVIRLGLEIVPYIYYGIVTQEKLESFLTHISFLGKSNIEGVVLKNYEFFNSHDKKVTMGKFVNEKFKEEHKKQWGAANPTNGDMVQSLVERFKTEARWQKAVQHMAEDGTLLGDPKDIGPLLSELGRDLLKDEEEAIKDALFKYAWPKIQRGCTAGFAQWYKEKLMEQAFALNPKEDREAAAIDSICDEH